MGSQKAIALPSAKHVRIGSTLLPESTSQLVIFAS